MISRRLVGNVSITRDRSWPEANGFQRAAGTLLITDGLLGKITGYEAVPFPLGEVAACNLAGPLDRHFHMT